MYWLNTPAFNRPYIHWIIVLFSQLKFNDLFRPNNHKFKRKETSNKNIWEPVSKWVIHFLSYNNLRSMAFMKEKKCHCNKLLSISPILKEWNSVLYIYLKRTILPKRMPFQGYLCVYGHFKTGFKKKISNYI